MKPNLYALLVGVSNYQRPVAKLPGCANDLKRMQEYLETEKTDFQGVHIRTLLDKESTKDNIVKGFQEHLGQAREGDVTYFYFTGHGTQEAADPEIWRYESDKKLECLVCYDSVEEDSNIYRFLADKELRWLINELWQKTKSHLVTVFDCCHSGENTRNVHVGNQVPEVEEKRLVARFGGAAFPKRAWSDFVFAKDIKPDDLKAKPMYEVIPEGRHVQLAACRNDESAYEVAGEGVFTKNLLDVLRRSRGAVTYFDMRSRIKNFIKNQYMQTPQIYVQGGDLSLGFTTFLGKSTEGRPLYGNVVKNKDMGWILDMGALHGISKRGEEITVETEKGEKLAASVVRVFPDHTSIRFETADEPKAEKAAELKGYVKDFRSAPIKVFLDAGDKLKKEATKLQKELEPIGNLYVTDKEYEADYCVVIEKEGINGFTNRITYPGEEKYYHDKKKVKHIRPLVMPATSLDDSHPEKVTASHLKHIAQWEYVKNLNNPNTFLFRSGFPLEVGMKLQGKDGKWKEVPLQNEQWEPTLLEQHNGSLAALTTVRLRNAYTKKLYVSVLSLSLNFEVYPNFLNPPGYGLNPGEEKIIDTIYTPQGEFPLSLSCEPEIEAFNLPYSPAWLLFIASTQEDVDVTTLELPALPGPLTDRTRFIGAARGEQDANANDWITRLVALKIQVPK
ncbi:MAG: caspase family protein [Saprospirales bacterium]|nr:caspase family protein [Saprospirales bacterium]MBK8493072.1 caspase family protein [Saprospirales bacterium]